MFNYDYIMFLEKPSPFVSDDENAYRDARIWGAKKALAIANGPGDPYYNLENWIDKMDRYSLINNEGRYIFAIARDVAMDIYDKLGGH